MPNLHDLARQAGYPTVRSFAHAAGVKRGEATDFFCCRDGKIETLVRWKMIQLLKVDETTFCNAWIESRDKMNERNIKRHRKYLENIQQEDFL